MPVLNEIRFVRGWLDNVRKFADEIIVIDMKSTDGTYEYLESQIDVDLAEWWLSYEPYEWPEHKVRNALIDMATEDYIVQLDADERVGDDFIETLNHLDGKLIHRYIEIAPWELRISGDEVTGYHFRYMIRKRSLWPIYENKGSKWLRNWRGQYPCYDQKVFKRDDRIRYGATGEGGNNCILQYKNFGHLSYHLPLCKTHKIPFYHLHYLHKSTNVRDKEEPNNLVEYENIPEGIFDI